MSGTFSSFGSALSALRYHRVAMDVASNNVANAQTAGYTRRMAVAQATGAPAVQALWSTWNGVSGGVESGGVERMVDALLDARSRTEHGTLSFLETRAASLVRFETTIGEPGENGVAAALSAFKQGWDDVANHPQDEAARSQLIGRGQTLVAAVRSQAAAVATEWADQRNRLTSIVEEVNRLASDLASLNGAIVSAENAGTDAGTLLDQRDQYALRLSQLTGATVSNPAGSAFNVEVNGVSLVNLVTASSLRVAGGSVTGDPALQVFLDVPATPPASGTVETDITPSAPASLSGELGGTYQLLVHDLPDYLRGLDKFTAELVDGVNTLHRAGFDLDGETGIDFFTPGTSDPAATTAAGISMSVTAARDVAAGAVAGTLDGSVALGLAQADLGSSTYRTLVTNFGVEVASARRVATNQGVLTSQVDASRESLSGVNIDEEMVNLLAAQRAYEGASRVITTLDSMLDTLINRTGLTR